MFYSFPVEIPANTPESAPVESVVKLNFGVICYVEVEFPPGCCGYVKLRVLHRRHQLWPTNPGDWFYTDGKVIRWDEYFELFELPFELILQGHSDGSSVVHTPTVRINVLPPLIAMMKYGGYPQYPQIRQIAWEGL